MHEKCTNKCKQYVRTLVNTRYTPNCQATQWLTIEAVSLTQSELIICNTCRERSKILPEPSDFHWHRHGMYYWLWIGHVGNSSHAKITWKRSVTLSLSNANLTFDVATSVSSRQVDAFEQWRLFHILRISYTARSTYGDPRLPPLEFGTVCHTTSRLHSYCLFSAVVWRPISSDAVFLDYTVVPAKWHSSLWTR